MYSLNVTFPRGRALLFKENEFDSAVSLFSDIVNDGCVLMFELTSVEDDQQELFDVLVKVYEARTHIEKGYKTWMTHIKCESMMYYNGYQEPEEMYDDAEPVSLPEPEYEQDGIYNGPFPELEIHE